MKIVVDSIVVEYLDEGQGEVVLMLHGWKDSLRTFDDLVLELSGSYRVVRLDLPGFGLSEMPHRYFRLSDYIQFVCHFLKKINIAPAYILGHSFGARIVIKAVATGAMFPKKVVLIGAAGIAKSRSFRNLFYKVIAKVGSVIFFIPPFSFFREKARKYIYQTSGSDYLGAGNLKEIYLNIIREDLSSYARLIKVPTLLVWGSEDTATPLADGKYFEQEIAGSKLVVVDGKSHFVHREASKEVSSEIKEFLA